MEPNDTNIGVASAYNSPEDREIERLTKRLRQKEDELLTTTTALQSANHALVTARTERDEHRTAWEDATKERDKLRERWRNSDAARFQEVARRHIEANLELTEALAAARAEIAQMKGEGR